MGKWVEFQGLLIITILIMDLKKSLSELKHAFSFRNRSKDIIDIIAKGV
jgi:hypothetical protein